MSTSRIVSSVLLVLLVRLF